MYTSTSYTPTSPHPLVRRLLYPILLLSTPLFPILLFAPVYCSLLLSFATVEFGCIRLLSLTIVLTSSSFYIFCVNDRSSRFVHDLLEGFEFLEGVRRSFTVTDDHFSNSSTAVCAFPRSLNRPLLGRVAYFTSAPACRWRCTRRATASRAGLPRTSRRSCCSCT